MLHPRVPSTQCGAQGSKNSSCDSDRVYETRNVCCSSTGQEYRTKTKSWGSPLSLNSHGSEKKACETMLAMWENSSQGGHRRAGGTSQRALEGKGS